MTIEQVIRVVFDDNAYTRNVAQAAQVSGRFDSTVASVTTSLSAMAAGANRAGAAQALAANSGGAFLAALQKQAATLTQQSTVIGKSEADLLRLKAAELGVAQQAGATVAALEEQARAVARLSAGAGAVENIRSLSALKNEQQALESGIAVDARAGRAKQDLIAQIERETAALTRLAGAQRGAASGTLVDRVQAAAADDPEFAARAQPALVNLGAAQAARDNAVFISSLERMAATAGKTRTELLALEAAERGVGAQATPLIARLAAAERQMQGFGRTGKLTAIELQQVGFQLNDFFVQIASGSNPLIAFVQQGSQLSGTFGGMGAAVRALTSLITPLGAGIAGLAVAAGGFAIAATKTEQWQRALSDLQATLQGTGRGGQFSNGQLSALIEQISQAPGVTREAATKTVAELARVSQISADLFGKLGLAAADYARITGTDVPTAAKALAEGISKPEQGVKTFEAALGRLSLSTLATVQRLSDMGDRVGAQRVLFAAVEEAVKGLATSGLTPLQKATNDLGNSWERLMGTLRESDGLKAANSSLSELVDRINTAVANAPKLGLLGTLAAQSGPLAALARGAQAVLPERQEPGRRRVEGVVTTLDGATLANVQGSKDAAKALKDEDKTVLSLIESYKSQGSELTKLTALRQKARDVLARLPPGSDEAKLFRDRISGLGERIESLNKKGGDPDRDLKRAVAADIENARREAETQRATVAAGIESLRGEYDAGLVDLETYHARRRELNERAAAAEQDRLARVADALNRQQTQGKKEETRESATDKLVDTAEQQRRAAADAERASTKEINELKRERLTLDRQIAGLDAEIAQLAGDEATAERLRNQQRIEQARILAAQRFGAGSPEAQSRVDQVTRLLQLQADSNELQRQSQALSQRSAIEEERFLIAARAGAATREETERGLFEIRSRAIVQLAEQVRQADAQVAALGSAATPNSPAVLFAQQLRLELERLSQVVDPALERMRAVGDEVADAFGRTAGAIALNARDARSAVFSLAQSLGQIAVRETVERPFADLVRQQVRGATEGPGAVGDVARQVFNVGGGAAGAGAAASPSVLGGVLSGAAGASGGNTLPTASASAAAALNQLARVAGGGAAAGPGGTFAGALEGVFGAFDTSGAGTHSTPSAERDILRRMEAGVTEDVITPLGEAVEGVLPRFGDLGKGLLSAAEGLQGLPQLLQSILSSMSGSGGSQASGLSSIFSSITGGSGSSGGLDWIGNAFISMFGLAEGGAIRGPGTATSDSIPILASDGEFMVRARAAQQPGASEFLARFNAIGMPAVNETFLSRVQARAGRPGQINMPRGFAEGGYVSNARAMAADYAGYAAGGWVEESVAERTPMQRREVAAPVVEQPMNYSPTFVVPAPTERRTQDQLARIAFDAAQRARSRGIG